MQAGPGAENAFAGVATAFADSVPIFLIPASNPRNRTGVHPTFSPSNTYSSVTKWSEKVSVIESIPEMMRRSFSQLRMGRPSPVLLEVPSDILRGEIPNGMNLDYSPVSKFRASGDPNDVKINFKAAKDIGAMYVVSKFVLESNDLILECRECKNNLYLYQIK